MINNLHNMLPPVLVKMDMSSFTFHPTGSRYFGGNVEAAADWDFFVEDSRDVREYLSSLGFKVDEMSVYAADKTVATVYTYEGDLSHDRGLTRIDVQVIHPDHFSSKQLVQKLLKDQCGSNGLPGDKAVRSQIWDLMFGTLRALNIAP